MRCGGAGGPTRGSYPHPGKRGERGEGSPQEMDFAGGSYPPPGGGGAGKGGGRAQGLAQATAQRLKLWLKPWWFKPFWLRLLWLKGSSCLP